MGHTKTCSELKNIFAALIKQSKTPEASCAPDISHNLILPENYTEREAFLQTRESAKAGTTPPDTLRIPSTQNIADVPEKRNSASHLSEDELVMMPKLHMPAEALPAIEQRTNSLADTFPEAEASKKSNTLLTSHQERGLVFGPAHDSLVAKEPDTVSNSREIRKTKLKIKVKQSAASSRAEDPDMARVLNNQDGHNDADRGASSSVSVDAPHRNLAETMSTGNHNYEDANSCHDVGSRVTASIGSAKPTVDADDLLKELQCTADSSKVSLLPPSDDHLPSSMIKIDTAPQKEKAKKKDKEKRKKHSHDDDPEHKEMKRRKKEKRRKEKELAKLLAEKPKTVPSTVEGANREEKPIVVESVVKNQPTETGRNMGGGEEVAATAFAKELQNTKNAGATVGSVELKAGETNTVMNRTESSSGATPSASSHKIKIKLKSRTLGKP